MYFVRRTFRCFNWYPPVKCSAPVVHGFFANHKDAAVICNPDRLPWFTTKSRRDLPITTALLFLFFDLGLVYQLSNNDGTICSREVTNVYSRTQIGGQCNCGCCGCYGKLSNNFAIHAADKQHTCF